MGIAQDRLAAMLREYLAPRLRECGYRGSGQNFHRRFIAHWGVINIQRSQWDWGERATFAINLGVASDVVQRGMRPDTAKPPPEVVCQWRARLGHLATGRDVWWEVREETTDEAVAAVGAQAWAMLETVGLPAIAQYADDARILEHRLGAPHLSFPDLDEVGLLLAGVGGTEPQQRRFAEILREARDAWRSLPDEPRPAQGPKRTAANLTLLQSPRADKRAEAAYLLGGARGSSTALEALRGALDDPDDSVSVAAARSLVSLRDSSSLDRVLRILVETRDRHGASWLARDLERYVAGEQGLRPAIVQALSERLDRAVGFDLVGVGAALDAIA